MFERFKEHSQRSCIVKLLCPQCLLCYERMFIDEPSLRYNAQLYKGGTIVPMSRQEDTVKL